MRAAFLKSLMTLAEQNSKLMLLTADLGFGLFESFIEKFPKQYLNVGVAEQNMLGVATGLALEGYTIFAYSIGNFATFRCLEQIRNDACYHGLNINIVSMGGGFSYGPLGMSHHATEDFGILRILPGLTILAPYDSWETEEATKALAAQEGVGYLRLEKNTAAVTVREQRDVFKIGKSRCLRHGKDVALIATGSLVAEALNAAEKLSALGIEARVISMHTIKPLDYDELNFLGNEIGAIVTIEEHMVNGGLGSAVAEYCLEQGLKLRFFSRIGLQDRFSAIVGDQQFLRHKYHMDAESIIQRVSQLMSLER